MLSRIWTLCVFFSTRAPRDTLSPGSPSARPQPTICTVRAPRVCHPPSSPWLENPLPPLPTSKPWTPPWPIGSTMAPSSLLSTVAHLSTGYAGLPHPSGSALVCHRPSCASGLHSSGCASSLRLRQAPPSLLLHLGPLSLRLHRGLLDPRLRIGRLSHLLHLGPPDPPCRLGSSALRLRLGLLRHLLRRRWLAPWSSQPFLHHGSSLCRLHRRSWLWPGSHIMAVAWVPPDTACSKPLLSSPWLLPPSGLPWFLLSPPWLLPPSSPPWSLSAGPLPGVRPKNKFTLLSK